MSTPRDEYADSSRDGSDRKTKGEVGSLIDMDLDTLVNDNDADDHSNSFRNDC